MKPALTAVAFQAVAMLAAALAYSRHLSHCERCRDALCDTGRRLAREAGQEAGQ